jgi:ABC-type enterobactin transport system permease subunit
VIVSVIGDGPLAEASVVAAAIAARLDVEANGLVLRRASASSYLLVLPDLNSVEFLIGLRQPVSAGITRYPRCLSWAVVDCRGFQSNL